MALNGAGASDRGTTLDRVSNLHTMIGGYDVELFVNTLDQDFICIICQGVLRSPVQVACNHIFCKNCILEWLKRQETCPCCRKPINTSLMLVLFKLSRCISRLKIKCKNESLGCAATFPLSQQYEHSLECLFEKVACPHQGCRAHVVRGKLENHTQHCPHWEQPCPMGCGTTLTMHTRAQHNCYEQLLQEHEAHRRDLRTMAFRLRRKICRFQGAMDHMKRHINLLCESLQVMDQDEGAENAAESTECNNSSSFSF